MWYTCNKSVDANTTFVNTTERVWRFITAKEARARTDEKIEELKKLAPQFLPMIEEAILEKLKSATPESLVSFEIPAGTQNTTCLELHKLLTEAGYTVVSCGGTPYLPMTVSLLAQPGHWLIRW